MAKIGASPRRSLTIHQHPHDLLGLTLKDHVNRSDEKQQTQGLPNDPDRMVLTDLIERLTRENDIFIGAFFTTHLSFVSSEELLARLGSLYGDPRCVDHSDIVFKLKVVLSF